VSSDTWPSTGRTPGLTKAQIAEAQANGVQPTRVGGFGYMEGPDHALVEYAGNHAAERFNHVHMYQDDPFCAQLWYQTHLNAAVFAGRTSATPLTDATCRVPRGPDRSWPALDRAGMFRAPSAAVVFGDVALPTYVRQGDRPLASSRGQLYDHIALSVADLDQWIAKLREEGVTFLEEPYPLGDTRAVMIEGPSREALELVEIA
jgi:catechol 2,3-dioxygenase-like lactoylglutathione lyase family enzyme